MLFGSQQSGARKHFGAKNPLGQIAAQQAAQPAGPGGIVATPAQRANSEAVAQRFGMSDAPADDAAAHWQGGDFGVMDRLPGAPPISMRDNSASPLGSSMRQPFDYEAAKAALLGEKPKVKDWQKVLAIVGDALVQTTGGTPMAVRSLVGRQNDYSKRQFEAAQQILDWQHGDYEAQQEADLRAATPYTIGRERLAFDPATGQTSVQYRGRQDGEVYADSLGFDRGSDEWNAALEDYVLRSSGPSAYERDIDLDDHRTSNDRALEGYRQKNRLEVEGARQGNRRDMVDYRNTNPAPSRAPRPRTNLPVVASPAEARRLPSGTRFRTPDGTVKIVP